MKKLSQSIADELVNNKTIDESQRQLCQYGFQVMLMSVGEILFVILVSAIVGNFFETVLFFCGFIPLRIYAGGYHADTQLRCFLVLIFVYILFSILLNIVPIHTYTLMVFALPILFNAVIVTLKAPLAHSRKSVNNNESKMYRKIALIICYADIAITIVCSLIFRENIYVFSFLMGQFSVAVSMAAAELKNKTKDRRES